MILVFGKSGQVATELQRQADVVALGRKDVDLANPSGCATEIFLRRPSVVINAAAYTAVDKAEEEQEYATIVNGAAPAAMAKVCGNLEIPFIHVSTDYVFSGEGNHPWTEEDPVDPVNAYGHSKLAGERAISETNTNWAILRTSWVFSAHGNNFVKTMLKLSETRDSLNVVNDQIGGPTPGHAIAQALLAMAKQMREGQRGGLYHFSGEPCTNWAEFAEEIFRQSGRKVQVAGIPTKEFPTPAKRPLNSRLNCSKIKRDFGIVAPDWKAGLSQVLKELDVTYD